MTSGGGEAAGWTAGALVFSGRPDPQWPVSARLAAELTALWDAARALASAPPMPTRLGYRGCWLREPGGVRLLAIAGAIVREVPGGDAEAREDAAGAFERAILRSAPRDVLPPLS